MVGVASKPLQRVLEQIPPVILIQPQLRMRMGFCAGDEVGQLLQWIARVQGCEGFRDLGQQALIDFHAP